MGYKEIFGQLIGLDDSFGGDKDLMLEAMGEVFDDVQADVDSLEQELFPDTVTDKLIARWEQAYNVIPDIGDSLDLRKENVIVRILLNGAITIQHYINIAAKKNLILSIDDRLAFLAGVSLVGVDPVFNETERYTVNMILSEQHRFPFLAGVSLVGVDPLVRFDIRNSIEELFEKHKRKTAKLKWSYFNWGFETGDLTSWRPFFSVIDSSVVRTGSFSAKLEAVGADINGVESTIFQTATGKKYQLDSWTNIPSWTAGTYKIRIDYYKDRRASKFLSSDILFSKSAVTAGWEQGIKTIGPSNTTPDFVFPDGTRAFKVKTLWDGTPTGIAYLDDFDIQFV